MASFDVWTLKAIIIALDAAARETSFSGIVPPGRGIVHQVNLEWIASVAREEDGVWLPDSFVGTDSHTTMINGLPVNEKLKSHLPFVGVLDHRYACMYLNYNTYTCVHNNVMGIGCKPSY